MKNFLFRNFVCALLPLAVLYSLSAASDKSEQSLPFEPDELGLVKRLAVPTCPANRLGRNEEKPVRPLHCHEWRHSGGRSTRRQ